MAYVGGGSRKTPPEILALVAEEDEGADEAFLRGVAGGRRVELCPPWPRLRLSPGAQALMAHDVHVLGWPRPKGSPW